MSEIYKRYYETDLLREKIINILKEQPMSVPGVCKLLSLDNIKMNWIFSRLSESGYILKLREKKVCPVMNKKYFIMQATDLKFVPKSIDEIVDLLSFRSANAAKIREERKGNKSEVVNHPNGRVIRLLDRRHGWQNPVKKHKTVVAIGSSFTLMDYA